MVAVATEDVDLEDDDIIEAECTDKQGGNEDVDVNDFDDDDVNLNINTIGFDSLFQSDKRRRRRCRRRRE
jgi:hypothetical protein